jgi:hypothetical protein
MHECCMATENVAEPNCVVREQSESFYKKDTDQSSITGIVWMYQIGPLWRTDQSPDQGHVCCSCSPEKPVLQRLL